MAAATSSAAVAEEDSGAFAIEDKPGKHVDVLRGGKVVARDVHAHNTTSKESRHDTYKPYLHVFGAAGA